jgi:hypothetical protein
MPKHLIAVNLDEAEYGIFAAAAHAKGESLEQFLRTAGRARSSWIGTHSISSANELPGTSNKAGQAVDKNGK